MTPPPAVRPRDGQGSPVPAQRDRRAASHRRRLRRRTAAFTHRHHAGADRSHRRAGPGPASVRRPRAAAPSSPTAGDSRGAALRRLWAHWCLPNPPMRGGSSSTRRSRPLTSPVPACLWHCGSGWRPEASSYWWRSRSGRCVTSWRRRRPRPTSRAATTRSTRPWPPLARVPSTIGTWKTGRQPTPLLRQGPAVIPLISVEGGDASPDLPRIAWAE
jgi:hypothetical protein